MTEIPSKALVSRVEIQAGITAEYGKKSWRPVQSAIDLVQNAMDAADVQRERKILKLSGINDYKPNDLAQQQIFSLADRLWRFPDNPLVADNAYASLQKTLGSNCPQREVLQEELRKFSPRPAMKVAIAQVTEPHQGGNAQYQIGATRLVDYTELEEYSQDWKVVGFRITDDGSGFAKELLGIMGGTTKKDNSRRRGRLGEGLRMSINHLHRSGADIRLLSRNNDEVWLAKPDTTTGDLVFQINARQERHATHITGTKVDVDFISMLSNPNIDPSKKQEIIQYLEELDPRLSEGLGKYIIPFSEATFTPINPNSDDMISATHEKGNRVYVRDLYIADASEMNDQEETLFSYNIANADAIGGSDRKTLKPGILRDVVKRSLLSLNDTTHITAITEAIQAEQKILETVLLTRDLRLSTEQQNIWRSTFESVFKFREEKALFVPSEQSSSQNEKLAKQQGYKLISIFPQILGFLENLYPDEIVTIAQLEKKFYIAPKVAQPRYIEEAPTQLQIDQEVDTPTREAVHQLMGQFSTLLAQDPNARNLLTRALVLDMYKIFYTSSQDLQSADGINLRYNILDRFYLAPDKQIDPTSFQTRIDVYAQLVNAIFKKSNFDTETQELLTVLAGNAILRLDPTLKTLPLPDSLRGDSSSSEYLYTRDARHEKDIAFLQVNNLVAQLQDLDISEPTLRAGLDEIRSVMQQKKLGRSDGWILTKGVDDYYFFDGKLYKFDSDSLTLSDYSSTINQQLQIRINKDMISFKSQKPKMRKLGKYILGDSSLQDLSQLLSEPEIQLQPQIRTRIIQPSEQRASLSEDEPVFIPHQLKDGDSMMITLSPTAEGRDKTTILVTREGAHLRQVLVDSETNKFYRRGEVINLRDASTSDIRTYGTVMMIMPRENYELEIAVNPTQMIKQREEANRGQEIIYASTTTDYRQQIWTDPKRIIIDIWQNHRDVDQNPSLFYTVVGPDYSVRQVSSTQLQGLGKNWTIIGIKIQDQANGYPTGYLTTLGASSKLAGAAGKYGEALKMIAGASLQLGLEAEFGSRDWLASPTSYTTDVIDYEKDATVTFNRLAYRMTWLQQPQSGSFSRFSIVSGVDPRQQVLNNNQISQLQEVLNQQSQKGSMWATWVDVLDPRNVDRGGKSGLERYILPSDALKVSDGLVDLLPDRPGQVFEKGLLLSINGQTKKTLFGYNFFPDIVATRERNSYDGDQIKNLLIDYFAHTTDPEIIQRILREAIAHQEEHYLEYEVIGLALISETVKTAWRKAFYEVYGNNAILSIRSYAESYYRDLVRSQSRGRFGGISYSYSEHDSARWEYYSQLQRAVTNEVHLENQALIQLPSAMTSALIGNVYTSQDNLHAKDVADIQISPEDRAKLFAVAQAVSSNLIHVVQSLQQRDETRHLLSRLISEGELNKRLQMLREISPESLHIKPSTFPSAAMVKVESGKIQTYLNINHVGTIEELVMLLLHEDLHPLSDERDYTTNFQRWFLMVTEEARRLSQAN